MIARNGTSVSTVLQALSTIACRLGVDTDANQLRRRFAIEQEELDNATLVAIARELGLEAKPLRVTFGELPRLAKALPAILRAKDGSALLLEGANADPMRGTVAIVRDPTASVDEVVTIEEIRLLEIWEGDVILIKRAHLTTDEQQPFGMYWLLGQVLRERKLFGDIAAAAVVNTVFALAPPFIFMIVLDRVLVSHSYATLNVLVTAILIMLAFETVIAYLRRAITRVATTRIDGRLNLYIVEKLLKLPIEYFEANPTGKTLSKIMSIWKVRHFLTGQLFGAFIETVPLIGLVPAMLILEWHLSLMTFVLAVLMFLVVMLYLRPMGKLWRRVQITEQAKGAHLIETIYGIRTVKSLAIEGRRRKEWDRRVAESIAAQYDFESLANYPQTLTVPL